VFKTGLEAADTTYSLCIRKESRFGQRDDFQNLILTFFIKIFIVNWYIYIFIKVFFKINLFIQNLYFETPELKNYS